MGGENGLINLNTAPLESIEKMSVELKQFSRWAVNPLATILTIITIKAIKKLSDVSIMKWSLVSAHILCGE